MCSWYNYFIYAPAKPKNNKLLESHESRKNLQHILLRLDEFECKGYEVWLDHLRKFSNLIILATA